MDKACIAELVFAAVDKVNLQLPRGKRLGKSAGTVLTGEGGGLDSLGLVNLLFNTEQKIESALGISVTLADEGAAAAGDAFRTLASFTDFVHSIVQNKLRYGYPGQQPEHVGILTPSARSVSMIG